MTMLTTLVTPGRPPAGRPLLHDMSCSRCGHARHIYLACSDSCACVPPPVPGLHAGAA